jgi:hypothetical protein
MLKLCGIDIDLEIDLTGTEMEHYFIETRAKIAAENPVATAQSFDHLVTLVLDVLIGDGKAKKGKQEKGIFGYSDCYYGTVETSQRGGLHLHFMVWLKDLPSRKTLRERLQSKNIQSEELKADLRSYVESTATNDIPGRPYQDLADEQDTTMRDPANPKDPINRKENYCRAFQPIPEVAEESGVKDPEDLEWFMGDLAKALQNCEEMTTTKMKRKRKQRNKRNQWEEDGEHNFPGSASAVRHEEAEAHVSTVSDTSESEDDTDCQSSDDGASRETISPPRTGDHGPSPQTHAEEFHLSEQARDDLFEVSRYYSRTFRAVTHISRSW